MARTFGKNVMRVTLTMRNPRHVDARGQNYSQLKHTLNKLTRMDRSRHDGVIIHNYHDAGKYGNEYLPSTHYIPFSTNQIRVNLKESPFGGLLVSRTGYNVHHRNPIRGRDGSNFV